MRHCVEEIVIMIDVPHDDRAGIREVEDILEVLRVLQVVALGLRLRVHMTPETREIVPTSHLTFRSLIAVLTDREVVVAVVVTEAIVVADLPVVPDQVVAVEVVVVAEVAAVEEVVVEAAIKMTQQLEQIKSEQHSSFFPSSFLLLGEREQQFFRKLEQYQAPWLCERLIKKGEVKDETEYNALFGEFKKYVALLTISQQSLGMVSTKVDNLWHEFILFTREYMDFCQQFYGKYIHHRPYTSFHKADPNADTLFYDWYHRVYGHLPTVWK